ncbi:MAG TPA: ABC transporter substrate-binding protein [Chloroflexota bacterium]|nr:ABC transporter substrate-binding protein [Chloroflexota bacterium]
MTVYRSESSNGAVVSDRPARGRRTLLGAVIPLGGAGLLAACRRGQVTPIAAPTPAPAAAPGPSPTPLPDSGPAVAGAANARQYRGQRITYYGDSVGIGARLDQVLATQFGAETGVQVQVIPKPQSATENFSAYQRFFQAGSAAVDLVMLDVIWPGAFAPHLLDLSRHLAVEAGLHYPSLIENNTVDGRLIAIPWFGDFGMLYYRTDLLQKYGFAAPPTTWDELEQQARRIQDGERATNRTFTGFLFQGNSYEGLTCTALEWLASSGGGRILEADRVTLDNPRAIAMLDRARRWVGAIAPRGVTSYQEEDSRNVFQGGNGAFLRNWPYVYSLAGGDDSPIKGKFDVAPLPAAAGQRPVGTVGGWQIAVSRYSRSPEAAVEFARYLTSPEVQTYRAAVGSFVPTMPKVAEDPEVLRAEPFLSNLRDVERVPRPSRSAADRYNQVSTAFFQGVNQMLNGADPARLVPQVAQRIQRIQRLAAG